MTTVSTTFIRKQSVSGSEIIKILTSLDVGQSYLAPRSDYYATAQTKSKIAVTQDKSFIQRKVDNETFRVWRTK